MESVRQRSNYTLVQQTVFYIARSPDLSGCPSADCGVAERKKTMPRDSSAARRTVRWYRATRIYLFIGIGRSFSSSICTGSDASSSSSLSSGARATVRCYAGCDEGDMSDGWWDGWPTVDLCIGHSRDEMLHAIPRRDDKLQEVGSSATCPYVPAIFDDRPRRLCCWWRPQSVGFRFVVTYLFCSERADVPPLPLSLYPVLPLRARDVSAVDQVS
jgi:hypothetical protein